MVKICNRNVIPAPIRLTRRVRDDIYDALTFAGMRSERRQVTRGKFKDLLARLKQKTQ